MENNKSKSKWKRNLLIVIVVIIAIPVAEALLRLATQGNLDKPEDAIEKIEANKAVVFNSPIDGSVIQVKKFLEDNLNDPDSYEPVEWGEVRTDSITHNFYVIHKFRAKNGFGGKMLTTVAFEIDSLGKVVDTNKLR